MDANLLEADSRFEDDALLVKVSATCVAGHNLAQELEQELGWEVVPPRVPTTLLFPQMQRQQAENQIFLQRWVRGAQKLDSGLRATPQFVNELDLGSLARVSLFEYLMEKPDAHDGNRVVSITGRVWSIDHDLQWLETYYGSWLALLVHAGNRAIALKMVIGLLEEIESHKLNPRATARRELLVSKSLTGNVLP